jgi:Asp-tRNA(Asn)/Glu-tRNA(Gln) amidotransferase A subunit family amidase
MRSAVRTPSGSFPAWAFIGLPVVAVPVMTDCGLPVAVQIIAPPWREDVALRIAQALQSAGIAHAPEPKLEP